MYLTWNLRILFMIIQTHGIDYQIVIPTKDALESYYETFVERGNSEEWIKNCISSYDRQLPVYIETGKPIIYLNKGDNLENYLQRSNQYPKLVPK